MKPALGKAAVVAVVLSILYFVEVPAQPYLQLCPFHWLTGRPCPLCGLTRALFALAKGRWLEAIGFHALSPLVLILLASLLRRFRYREQLWTVGLGAIGFYGVIRMTMM